MNDKQEFERLYVGVYECDPREKALLERVKDYFVATDDVGFHVSVQESKRLKRWCEDNGYSKGDLNRAKVIVNQYTSLH